MPEPLGEYPFHEHDSWLRSRGKRKAITGCVLFVDRLEREIECVPEHIAACLGFSPVLRL